MWTTLQVITIAISVSFLYSALVKSTILSADRMIGAYLQSHFAYPKYAPIVWFIPCIFCAKCIFQIILRISRENSQAVFVLSMICTGAGYFFCRDVGMFLPWHVQIAALVQVFLMMGYFYSKYGNRLKEYETLILCISTIVYMIIIFKGKFAADLALMKFSDMSRYMVAAFFGTIMMVMLSKRVDNVVFRYVGKNSLFMFVFQSYCINSIYRFFNTIGAEKETKSVVSLLATILIVIILSCFCYLRDFVYCYINKKYGKNYKPII